MIPIRTRASLTWTRLVCDNTALLLWQRSERLAASSLVDTVTHVKKKRCHMPLDLKHASLLNDEPSLWIEYCDSAMYGSND